MRYRYICMRKLLCVLLMCAMLVGFAAPAYAVPKKGAMLTVKADYSRIRAKPKSGSEVIGKLSTGNHVKFLKDYRGWYKIEYKPGKTGFMYKSFLRSSASSTAKVGKLYHSKTKNQLVLRKAASKSAKVRTRIKYNKKVVLIEKIGKWGLVRVVSNGKVGYVKLSKLRKA